MIEEVRINHEYYGGNKEDYDALREAVKKLAFASEEQFDSIKKEKWYNRVFDMVTFSQKGKKRIAEQVGSLAQAQQIIIELLMRLSDNDSGVAQLVAESMEDINRIQEQNIYLFSKIKKLESISLGIKSDMDLNKMSEINKEILCACLYYINLRDENSTDEQKKFANQVIKYIDVDVQMENPLAALENMEIESKKKILSCCMEYMFLHDYSNDGYKMYEDFIAEFDFGNKTVKSIERQISSLYRLRGIEGFIAKYQPNSFEALEDFFVLDFKNEDDVTPNKEDVYEEMTDEVISTIMQIKMGEAKTYSYKNVHLNAYINCEGELTFDHCIINYNETDDGDEITLGEGAKLNITNSVVICRGFDTNFFVTCEGNNQITLDKDNFEDCSYFISADNNWVFSMTNCQLHNCYDEFLTLNGRSESDCIISNNIIIQDEISSFHIKENQSMYPTLINVQCRGNNVFFSNNSILEEESFRKAVVGGDGLTYFSSEGGEVKNCSFSGISQPIIALKYIECRFEKCISAISPKSSCFYSEEPCIDNCVFIECTNVIKTVNDTHITNCQFVSCYDDIISPHTINGRKGGVSVEFCQFVNTKNKKRNDVYNSIVNGLSSITFRRSKESESRENYLKKCIFDGVELGDNFLVAAIGKEKPSGIVTNIENCDFKNCSTQRASGKIVKEYIKYDTVLKKDVDFLANYIFDCRGLDKVNKEGTETDEVDIKTKSTSGNSIGSALAMGVIGVVGGPAVIAVGASASVVTNVIKMVKRKDDLHNDSNNQMFCISVENVTNRNGGSNVHGVVKKGIVEAGTSVYVYRKGRQIAQGLIDGIYKNDQMTDKAKNGESIMISIENIQYGIINKGDILQ